MNYRIDLLKLYSQSDSTQWNEFLSKCVKANDIKKLADMLNACQRGMDHCAKNKLNTEKMNVWFARLVRSIEKSIKIIVRKKNPNPLDIGLIDLSANFKDEKAKRDNELKAFIKKVSY